MSRLELIPNVAAAVAIVGSRSRDRTRENLGVVDACLVGLTRTATVVLVVLMMVVRLRVRGRASTHSCGQMMI